MELSKQNVLFFTRTMKLGGTENVVLQLCEIYKPLVNKIVVCSSGGMNVEKLNMMGIRHYEIMDIEQKKPKVILSTMRMLGNIVAEENITIIHTHHRMAAFYIAMLKLYKKCIFVNTSHNIFYDKIRLTRFAYKHAHLVACGKMVKENLVKEFGMPESQVKVIHNAIKSFDEVCVEDNQIAELRRKGSFIVGNVGRLSEQKGMEYFIKAIPEVIKRRSMIKFVIVGSGEDEKKLESLVHTMKIEKDVLFLGYRNDIQNIMSQLDLLVLSSLWEGLPLTPIEAFSVGKTIIATAVDGTVEIVRDGVDGFLIQPKDIDSIVEKIVYLYDNNEILEMMALNAKERYVSEFTFDVFAKKYIDFYEEI